jgi:tetratricopeptide (TPR) repeat protein
MKQAAAFPFRHPQYDAMPTPRGLLRMLIITVCLSLAQPFAAVAQTNAPTPLPPAAQEALNKGIIAAKVSDYLLAIRYFEEARKLAPQAPVIYLNMGLAESRIPGRELRAMAWFGAYLAAYPDAPNAAAVKEQIGVLEVRSQSNISRLIATIEDVANQIPRSKVWPEDQWVDPSDMRRFALADVASLWQENGDFTAALKTASSHPSNIFKSGLQKDIGWAQIKAGDLKGAQRTFTAAMQTADSVGYSGLRMDVLITNIAAGHARTGDIVGALQSVDRLRDDYLKSQAQFNIALQQVRAGDVAGSRKTFTIADQTAERIQDPDRKSKVKLFFAKEKKEIDTGNTVNASGQPTATAPPPTQPVVTVSDWLNKLDDDRPVAYDENDRYPLNTAPFLDLAGYLKSLPPSKDVRGDFGTLHETAKKIVRAQNAIAGMLKQQAKK